MPLSGPTHISLLVGIAAAAVLLSVLCRRGRVSGRRTRFVLGCGLAVNELIWWVFRYSHEGVHLANLPLQLCDITLWATVLACITLRPAFVEFAYFAGLAGAGMALLTPDLWTGWPSYPAIYFFAAHGTMVVACSVLVFGGIAPLVARRGVARVRSAGGLCGGVRAFNAIFGTNYMYLCRKPRNASLLDAFGPWPIYLLGGAAAGLALFWLLWLPVRPPKPTAP